MTHRPHGRSSLPFIIAAAVIIVATAVVFYLNRQPANSEPAPELTGSLPTAGAPTAAAPAQPANPETPPVLPTPTEPLPALDESDAEISSRLLALAPAGLKNLLLPEALARKFVVLIDNIARGQLAPRYNSLQSPAAAYPVLPGANPESYRVNAAGFSRYDAYTAVVTAIDVDALADLYWRYYPLLQQAFVDLGYPRAQFHPRLLSAIDVLLAAPPAPTDAELVQPQVLYRYADPALESLPAAQKQLMRAGPDNQKQVQDWLRQLRTRLAQ